MTDIFLSYSREDQARAKLFAEAFERQNFNVWWDAGLRAGEAYDQVTEKALREAKAVVVLWSKQSVDSRWVRAEATLADRNKTLVPCMIEHCERPIMFELTQTADLSHWDGATDDKAWAAFLSDVRRFIAKGAAAAPEPAVVAPPPSPHGERGERPSLAVMPFANRSGVAKDDALAFGMVEDIISAISLCPDLRVLASSSTQQWAGKPTDLRVVGRDLGVRCVLEGNTRRAGANLRVTVQLVEAATGVVLWTQKFDRALSELADLQESLVTEMAGRLGVQVQNLEFERALKKPGDITAYEAVQRAQAALVKLRLDRLPGAIADARRAVAIAPDYAAAHAALAGLLAMQFMWTGSDNTSAKREVLRHNERALVLAPNDPTVLANSAITLNRLDRPREAILHAERAVEQNPNIAFCQAVLATVYLRVGRNEDAIAGFDTEETLAPGTWGLFVSCARRSLAHFQAQQLEPAVDAMERSFRQNPDFAPTLVLRAALCGMVAREEDARAAVRRLRELEPDTSVDIHGARLLAWGEPTQAAPLVTAFRRTWDETANE